MINASRLSWISLILLCITVQGLAYGGNVNLLLRQVENEIYVLPFKQLAMYMALEPMEYDLRKEKTMQKKTPKLKI